MKISMMMMIANCMSLATSLDVVQRKRFLGGGQHSPRTNNLILISILKYQGTKVLNHLYIQVLQRKHIFLSYDDIMIMTVMIATMTMMIKQGGVFCLFMQMIIIMMRW